MQVVPHYYTEDLPLSHICKLHGWTLRETPRRIFDAVIFSNEVDLLEIRMHVCDSLLPTHKTNNMSSPVSYWMMLINKLVWVGNQSSCICTVLSSLLNQHKYFWRDFLYYLFRPRKHQDSLLVVIWQMFVWCRNSCRLSPSSWSWSLMPPLQATQSHSTSEPTSIGSTLQATSFCTSIFRAGPSYLMRILLTMKIFSEVLWTKPFFWQA